MTTSIDIKSPDSGRLFQELPGQIEPFENPFERAGRPSEPCKFIYLTNRGEGRYSGLLPMDHSIGWEMATYFPMGYTQIWSLEKRFGVCPDHSARGQKGQDTRRSPQVRYPKGIDRAEWAGSLYVVLREPVGASFPHDVIGAGLSEESAMGKAGKYAERYGRRVVVALLIGDMAWH